MRAVFLFIFMLTGGIYAQDTIIPLWPKNKIANHIPSPEKEVLVKGDDLMDQ